MKYERQNFKDGNVLNAGQLNHIEDGIIDLEEGYEILSEKLNTLETQTGGTILPAELE